MFGNTTCRALPDPAPVAVLALSTCQWSYTRSFLMLSKDWNDESQQWLCRKWVMQEMG